MTSTPNAPLLSALLLALLLRCAPAAPLDEAPADGQAGDPSGEEGGDAPSDLVSASQVWTGLLGATARHRAEFEMEFHHQMKYNFLQRRNTPSLPASCPNSNFSMEVCFHRLTQGLLQYKVLLKHVEKEYPSSQILLQARNYSSHLINLIKEKMRHPGRVTAPTSSQEEQLLRSLDSPDTFERMMTAHSILYHLHYFLLDCKRRISKRERDAHRSLTKQTPL